MMPKILKISSILFLTLTPTITFAKPIGTSANDPLIIQAGVTEQVLWHPKAEHAARQLFYTAINLEPVYLSEENELKPGYVKSWKYFEKEKKYRIKIDDSLIFHNGSRLRALDFEYMLIRVFLSKVESYLKRDLREDIEGLDKIQKGQKFTSGMCQGIRVIDNSTVDIYLKSNNKRFIDALAYLDIPIAPLGSFKEDHVTWKKTPIGLGPYRISDVRKNGREVLLKSVKPSKNMVRYALLTNSGAAVKNKAHIAVGTGISNMKNLARKHSLTRAISKNPSMIVTIDFNFDTELGSKLKFRKLVFETIKKENLFPGDRFTKTDSLYPEIANKKSTKQIEKDVKISIKEIQKLSQNDEIGLFYSAGPKQRHQVPQHILAIESALEKMGVKLRPVPTDSAGFSAADTKNNTVLRLSAVTLDLSDQFNVYSRYLQSLEKLEDEAIVSRYRDLITRGVASQDFQSRLRILQDLEHMNKEYYLQVPLVHGYEVYYYDSSKIKDVGIHPLDLRLDISKIRLTGVNE